MREGPYPEARGLVCGSAALVFGPHVWTCHRLVFGDDFADYDTWYLDLFEKHAKRSGHRLVLTQEDDIVTGYAWGYTGKRGQYWSDLLCDSLPGPIASQWVGGSTSTSSNSQFSPHTDAGAWDRHCMTACSRV